MVAVSLEGLRRERVDGEGGCQRLDVIDVGEPRVLGAGRRPERALRTGTGPAQSIPSGGGQGSLEEVVGQAGVGNGDLALERVARHPIEQRVTFPSTRLTKKLATEPMA